MLCTDNLFQDLRLRIPYLQRNFARARQHVARMVQRAQAMIRSDQIKSAGALWSRKDLKRTSGDTLPSVWCGLAPYWRSPCPPAAEVHLVFRQSQAHATDKAQIAIECNSE